MIASQFSSGMVIQKMIIKKNKKKKVFSKTPWVAPSDETSCSAA